MPPCTSVQVDLVFKDMHIKVEYTMEDVGAGIQVEKLTISLANDNPDPKVETDSSVLVDGLYATQLSIPENKPYLNPALHLRPGGLGVDPLLALHVQQLAQLDGVVVVVNGLYATQLSIPENKPYLNPHILGDINGANADLDKLTRPGWTCSDPGCFSGSRWPPPRS